MKTAKLEYFNNAPIGSIYADEANAIPAAVLGPKDGNIKDEFGKQINNMEQRGTKPDAAWDAALEAISKITG